MCTHVIYISLYIFVYIYIYIYMPFHTKVQTINLGVLRNTSNRTTTCTETTLVIHMEWCIVKT